MTIKRTFGGQEYEIKLTEREMTDAFYEQQHKWDISNIYTIMDWLESENNNLYCCMKNDFTSDEDLLSRVAHRFRKYLEDSVTGEEEIDCMICAYQYMTDDRNKWKENL